MNFGRLLHLVPPSMRDVSGEVFYSGRASFEHPSRVYLLGLNPGSDSADSTLNSIEVSLEQTAKLHTEGFSRYVDERWNRSNRSYTPMQIRVRHLLRRLGLDPRQTPSSNLVFSRSIDVSTIRAGFGRLAEQCWPVHEEVIRSQGVKVVVCMGGKAFEYVARRLGAETYLRDYIETNRRQWRSVAYRNGDGVSVVGLTHPSRADWTNYNSDPSELVKWCLDATV